MEDMKEGKYYGIECGWLDTKGMALSIVVRGNIEATTTTVTTTISNKTTRLLHPMTIIRNIKVTMHNMDMINMAVVKMHRVSNWEFTRGKRKVS